MQQALASEGMALSFWKIAMRPGRPMMHGRLGDMHVLGLPGNPVSAYVCSILFLIPLIRRLSGREDVSLQVTRSVLGRDLAENDEREDYLRAKLELRSDATPVATPFPVQDSSMLAPLAQSQCLLIRPAFAPAARAGEPCDIIQLGL